MWRSLQTRELVQYFGNLLVGQVPNNVVLLQFNSCLRSSQDKFMSDSFRHQIDWHILFHRRVGKCAFESVDPFTICGQQNSIVAEIELGNHLHANYTHGVDSILLRMRIASMG